MPRIFATLIAIVLTGSGAVADDLALVIKCGTVAETKANGKVWDIGTGKKAWPDAYVKAWIYDEDGSQVDYGETGVSYDTFTPVWNKDVATVKAGQKIKFEVWDKDLKYDDLIGRHQFTLSRENIEKRAFIRQFDGVNGLQLEVSRRVADLNAPRILFLQPFPGPRSAKELIRTKDRADAVVLIHGLDLRDDGSSPSTPRLQDWQGSTSYLVKALAKDADVFSISYAQTTPVEEVAAFPELRRAIERVKRLGYDRVILLGHSAGGLVARCFVEEHPRAGATKVIQIATPNGGSTLATWAIELAQVPKEQRSFVKSLSPMCREISMKDRRDKKIPGVIDFVTVIPVAAPRKNGDGLLSRQTQWPWDLQDQGIPYVVIQGTHFEVMVHDTCLDAICSLVRTSQPRWDDAKVQEMKRHVFSLPK